MKKYLIAVIPVIILITLSLILFIYSFKEINNLDQYFSENAKVSILNLVYDQKKINDELNKANKNKKYTIENPYISLNPYGISPLSGIIIFNTKDEVQYDLYVNNKKVTTLEKTKNHIIPVYGLYEDYNNKITLKNDKDYDFYLKTEKSNIEYPLEIEKTYNFNELLFTVASYKTYLTGWDNEGKLRFYLTVDNRMDVEWLENGHFLIGTSQGQFAENFCAFVEMDYLGKIYNYYIPENGYSFEFQLLSNGNYMLAGGNNPVYIDEQLVYEINPTTGEKVSEINLAQIIKEIDSDFGDVYLGQKAIRNAFSYNESTHELLMSFRGHDAIISFNYETKKLNWVFTNPKNELFNKEIWKPYLIKLESGRYPLGQHSVILTKEGYVGFFNNGYNRLHGFENGGNDLVKYYKNNYSSGEVYEIKDGVAKLILSYDGDKKYFSHQYGSIKEYDNNYLIDFGYTLHDDYRDNSLSTLSLAEEGPDNIYAKIVEIDKEGNVVFEAKSEEGKFRAFKHSLYLENTNNVMLDTLNMYNNVKKSELNKINYKDLKLDDMNKWINSVNFTNNTFVTDYKYEEKDEVKLYFMNDIGETFEFLYKEKEAKRNNKIFNINLSGEYALFIKINDKLYNPKYTILFI